MHDFLLQRHGQQPAGRPSHSRAAGRRGRLHQPLPQSRRNRLVLRRGAVGVRGARLRLAPAAGGGAVDRGEHVRGWPRRLLRVHVRRLLAQRRRVRQAAVRAHGACLSRRGRRGDDEELPGHGAHLPRGGMPAPHRRRPAAHRSHRRAHTGARAAARATGDARRQAAQRAVESSVLRVLRERQGLRRVGAVHVVRHVRGALPAEQRAPRGREAHVERGVHPLHGLHLRLPAEAIEYKQASQGLHRHYIMDDARCRTDGGRSR